MSGWRQAGQIRGDDHQDVRDQEGPMIQGVEALQVGIDWGSGEGDATFVTVWCPDKSKLVVTMTVKVFPCVAAGCDGTITDSIEEMWWENGRPCSTFFCSKCSPRCPARDGLRKCRRPVDPGEKLCRWHREVNPAPKQCRCGAWAAVSGNVVTCRFCTERIEGESRDDAVRKWNRVQP